MACGRPVCIRMVPFRPIPKILRRLGRERGLLVRLKACMDECQRMQAAYGTSVARLDDYQDANERLQEEMYHIIQMEIRKDLQLVVTTCLEGSADMETALPLLLPGIIDTLDAGWTLGGLWSAAGGGPGPCLGTWQADTTLTQTSQAFRLELPAPLLGLLTRSIQEGAPAWTIDCLPSREAEALHDALAIPLLADGEAQGALLLLAPRMDRPDDELVEVFLGIGRQIGQFMVRKAAEAALRQAKEAAEAASSHKSNYLAHMSHELRTPLNAILLYCEMLADEARETGQPQFLQDLSRIEAAGKHLLALMNEILDLAKIEAGRMELHDAPFDLDGLLDDVQAAARPLIEEKGNRLDVENRTVEVEMRGDALRLRQVLVNLLGNASKFCERAVVRMTVEEGVMDGLPVLVFSVMDQGIGMTPETVAKLFQAYAQADPSTAKKYGGTGLGLSISLRLTQMMGGTLSVESAEGVGSTFTLRLPRERIPPQ